MFYIPFLDITVQYSDTAEEELSYSRPLLLFQTSRDFEVDANIGDFPYFRTLILIVIMSLIIINIHSSFVFSEDLSCLLIFFE